MKSRIYNRLITNKDKNVILLYGEISDTEVNAADFKQEIMEAENNGKPIEVHINSVGGDVYTGIAIIQAINESKGNIKIFIDGAASSIAGVIALCGKHLEMGKYARLMIHRVSGGGYGTQADLLKLVEEMGKVENSLCEIIAKKCNKDPKVVRDLYFDGADHWFSADEALKMGLIDGIFENEAYPNPNNIEEVYEITNKRTGYISPKDNGTFKGRLSNLLTLSKTATDEDYFNAIKKLKTQGEQFNTGNVLEDAIKKGWIKDEEKSIYHSLAIYNTALFVQKMQDIENKEKAKIIELICEAEKGSKIFPNERTLYKNIGEEMGFSTLEEILKIKPRKKLVSRALSLDFNNRENWTYDDWRNFSPKDLAENPKLREILERRNRGADVKYHSLEWYRKNDPEFLKNNPQIYKDLIEQEYKQPKK